MSVLGLLISSSLSRGRISWDGSSWRRLQMCGQLLWTTERKAWSKTMLAVQPIAASWSLRNNFYVDAMFEKQWLLVPETAYTAAAGGSLSNHFLQLWSSDQGQIAWMQRLERLDPRKHTQEYHSLSPWKYFSIHFESLFSVHYNSLIPESEVWLTQTRK